MSSYASDYLKFIEFVSSHTPPWVTLSSIALGFGLCLLLLSFSMLFVFLPYRSEVRVERNELDAEILDILEHDRDGWSRKLIERKKLKIAALDKKIGTLQNVYLVIHYLSMFLSFGGMYVVLQMGMNNLITVIMRK
ncbi:hypothetical protein MKW98_019646 [Papaver atlanticum]|uniref:Uncharacterized protein n=1 Tax=Papaver atlanticum TaxID=357466 RepID=A0AAD4S8Q2_9MAGN|nr:hypothetical protein MKW98_019646 [Papaver atlanticum]